MKLHVNAPVLASVDNSETTVELSVVRVLESTIRGDVCQTNAILEDQQHRKYFAYYIHEANGNFITPPPVPLPDFYVEREIIIVETANKITVKCVVFDYVGNKYTLDTIVVQTGKKVFSIDDVIKDALGHSNFTLATIQLFSLKTYKEQK